MTKANAVRILNRFFADGTIATRARMLAAADVGMYSLVEYRTIIRDATEVPHAVSRTARPLTVEEAADIINQHFEELPARDRVSMLRAFNITRPAFDLDYIRIIVESEFRCIRSGVTTGGICPEGEG